MNVMQQLGPDLPQYGTVLARGSALKWWDFFWSSPTFGRKMLQKSSSAKGPAQ